MSKKHVPVLFGAKRAGVTYLYEFESRVEFDQAKAAAKRIGVSLAELLSGRYPGGSKAPELPSSRTFAETDKKSSTFKIDIRQCDEFTRKCFARAAKYCGYSSVEDYIRAAALRSLVTDEEESICDPQTEEVVIQQYELGSYRGCHVDKDATELPPSNFTRIPIPAGTIVETYA
jgi:hypothetical protein